jgi:Domain of unknown function (DUF4394)
MHIWKRFQRVAAVALGTFAALAGSSSAATLAVLQDGKTIVWVDTEEKKVLGSVGLAGGASLVGFDVRPSDGRLYGLTPDGAVVTVDAKTGMWTKVSQLSQALPAGVPLAVDFNPVADRLRVIGANGMNLRVNVQDGQAVVDGMLKYADGDTHKAHTPSVAAAGYTNSVAGAKETALFDIDLAAGMLLRQAPPNDGTLNTVGPLGIPPDGPVAFDVWSDGAGANVGWLLHGGRLHSVNLSTGAATAVGRVNGLSGRVTDVAILPVR